MKIIRFQFPLFFALIMAVAMLLSVANARADYTILHNFGANGDGSTPYYGSPILSGSTLYGMATFGGSNGAGTLFKINTDGTGYTILHNFGGSGDGDTPHGSPILSSSTLYGMTYGGGSNGAGTLFKMNTDGTGYTILHNFSDFSGDGYWPFGTPILSGSTLYGMTSGGGSYGGGWGEAGTLFKINIDGTGYTILHNFGAFSGDGAHPWFSPILSGSTLYGATHNSGSFRYGDWRLAGTLFKMNTDGTGYASIHNFDPSSGDGGNPVGPILSDSTLYGVTAWHGSYGGGVLYKMNTDGTGYTILHNFGGSGDGAAPHGGLILSGSTLYGMTRDGGSNGGGVLFRYSLSEQVSIDIKPGSYPNSINLSSKGVVPVAVLTTDGFDALTIDTTTVVFAGASAVHSSAEDVNGDGRLDMVFHFDTQKLNLDSTSTSATLTGKTVDGRDIEGTDSVNIVPKKK